MKYGFSENCPGCTWSQNTLGARCNHTPSSTSRFEECMRQGKDDGERVSRAKARQDDWLSREVEKGAGADAVVEDKANARSEAVHGNVADDEMGAGSER